MLAKLLILYYIYVCVKCVYIYCILFTAMCIEGDVRLGVGNLTGFYASINDVEDYYFIKDELATCVYKVLYKLLTSIMMMIHSYVQTCIHH